jgi:hypothetical protein
MRCGRILIVALLLSAPIAVQAAEYDPQRAGHPIRIAAYVLHPVGVLLDYVLFRPAWWLGQYEPVRTIFGVEEDLADDPKAD